MGLKSIISNIMQQEEVKSTLGIQHSTLRNHPLHSVGKWLESKQDKDGAEGLWRIHDNIYDFKAFVEFHPGGQDWIKRTKGTDITEAFESHHITSLPTSLLSKYFVREATCPRNYPFTFHETGFYRTLKRKAVEELRNIPKINTNKSKIITDILFVTYVLLFFMAVKFHSFTLGVLSGIALCLTATAAHNFFHQKDNFRMHYFDFTMMMSREWRISHALSHHLYPNTIYDFEISSFEPFLQYMPVKKHFIMRYCSWIYSIVICLLTYFVYFVRTLIQSTEDGGESFTWGLLLPFTTPLLTWILTSQPAALCCIMFAWMISISSLNFAIIGLNAGHHHPMLFHDGDTPRPKEELDWGVYQLDAVFDRKDITGSDFLVLTNFGDHALHHLFPTLDHAYLKHLYPVFLKTCTEFGVTWKFESQLEAVKGQYLQLAKVTPTKTAPVPIRKVILNGAPKTAPNNIEHKEVITC